MWIHLFVRKFNESGFATNLKKLMFFFFFFSKKREGNKWLFLTLFWKQRILVDRWVRKNISEALKGCREGANKYKLNRNENESKSVAKKWEWRRKEREKDPLGDLRGNCSVLLEHLLLEAHVHSRGNFRLVLERRRERGARKGRRARGDVVDKVLFELFISFRSISPWISFSSWCSQRRRDFDAKFIRKLPESSLWIHQHYRQIRETLISLRWRCEMRIQSIERREPF